MSSLTPAGPPRCSRLTTDRRRTTIPGVRPRLILGLAAMLAIAGCGGGNTTTHTDTQTVTTGKGSTPTRSEFIKQADAICANYRPKAARLEREIQDIGQPQNVEQLHRVADLYRQLAAGVARQAEKLRKLTPPAGDESIIDNWLSTGQTTTSLARDFADAIDAAKGTNGSRLRSLAKQISAYSSKARGIAQGYGFKVCGSESG